ncbi:MAG: type II toxin-antitoxin system VapC family toxin [Anaerolineales bacterium]|nr:type II toxin-antitoxin system VapC family toxin [Anaerolineales bacterium]
MANPIPSHVLDTSALIAFTDNEDGADTVKNLLQQAEKGEVEILVSFASWMELYYIYLQEQDQSAADQMINDLKRLSLVRVDSDESMGRIAGDLKAHHRISFADAWVAALAFSRKATLVHKDPEFDKLSHILMLHPLPYK